VGFGVGIRVGWAVGYLSEQVLYTRQLLLPQYFKRTISKLTTRGLTPSTGPPFSPYPSGNSSEHERCKLKLFPSTVTVISLSSDPPVRTVPSAKVKSYMYFLALGLLQYGVGAGVEPGAAVGALPRKILRILLPSKSPTTHCSELTKVDPQGPSNLALEPSALL
jgi:hypothetical protein